MTKHRIAARDQRAPLTSPHTRTVICARCQVENHSPDGALPETWMAVAGGAICPDCTGTKGRHHG
ncbi:hypothetical protein [Sphingobium abikonense]|uniref:hypothetical protein n=1 Tax=Sphingobium abikonense TaxID=86193 RepID=UPI000787F34C|nr:hypothetical protein [Sphingobium abikonense]